MKYYVESYLSYLYKKVIVSRAGHDNHQFCYICEIVGEDSFLQAGPPKSLYFLCNSFFLRFSEKVSKQTLDSKSCLFFFV